MTTLKDIAREANVSVATVSYALTDSNQVSEETRNRIQKISKDMNYKPNLFAKGLRTSKTMSIGVIAEDISVFNAPEIINGLGERAEESGYDIILHNLRLCKRIGNDFNLMDNHRAVISKIVEKTVRQEVDGIIYIGAHYRDVTEIIGNIDKPLVCAYCFADERLHYSVHYNDETAAYQATKYLIDSGHRDIALITGRMDSMPCQARLCGYKRAMRDSKLLMKEQFIKVGNWEYEAGYGLTKELLQIAKPPTAVFALNDLMACGAIDAAKEAGFKIPHDLSIMGFDNRDICSYSVPKITTMEIPLNQMGKEAANILIRRLAGDESEQKHARVDCHLIVRQSVMQRDAR